MVSYVSELKLRMNSSYGTVDLISKFGIDICPPMLGRELFNQSSYDQGPGSLGEHIAATSPAFTTALQDHPIMAFTRASTPLSWPLA